MKGRPDADMRKEAAQLRALIKAVDAGDISKVRELREFIEARDFLRQIGDTHSQILSHLVGQLAGDKASTVEFIFSHIARRQSDLGYDEATEIERMMIDRIVMCWLRVVQAENYCCSLQGKAMPLKHHEYAERSLTRANSRFLKAVDALSRYRLMNETTRYAKARADLLDAKAKARSSEGPQQPAALALVKPSAG